MQKPSIAVIKIAYHYLYDLAFPCGQLPMDVSFNSDYEHHEPSNHTHRYNAIVEFTYDKLGKPCAMEITFLSEELEPEEDPNEPIPYEVTDKGREWLEGHPENEREEARIRQVFGLK